ncbi:hypothetical protein Godav_029371, partial [Gossypium davidsonii]|nr:hypothetical protein [Gossypium davidsonii]
SVDRVLQCYIRNISGPPSSLIENYFREAGFWHVATIGRGCKLDPKLISALIERWRPETHTFHLPCEKCTITLEDVQIQLGLPVDGSAFTGPVQSANWGALRYTFPKSRNDSTEVKRIRYARAYILEMIGGYLIGGYLMPDLSRNIVHLRWLLKLVNFTAVGKFSLGSAVLATYTGRCVGQHHQIKSKSEFQWTPYEDSAIQTVILDEFFQNPNIWHVKVPFVNYAIVDMHQTDRVLRQFRFRQPIPVAPEVHDNKHKIDLR